MAELITQVQIPEPSFRMSYNDKILFMGSCFSDYIGGKMDELRFQVCHNPFGTVYNPLSVAGNLETVMQKDGFTENDLSFSSELWYSYDHNTLFSDTDRESCLKKINTSLEKAKDFLATAGFLIITPGTSWVYRLKETGRVVANCHKQPASLFSREFISPEGSFHVLKNCLERIRTINPHIQFIFTVSPIRHWKDGAVGNQRSKAALILAIAMLQEWDPSIYYFPAYEIFMDELREYRYYAADMLHPSETGRQYIWEKFVSTFLSEDDKPILKNVESILNSVKHKPLFPNTKSYADFRKSVIEKIKTTSRINPHIDMSGFMKFFEE